MQVRTLSMYSSVVSPVLLRHISYRRFSFQQDGPQHTRTIYHSSTEEHTRYVKIPHNTKGQTGRHGVSKGRYKGALPGVGFVHCVVLTVHCVQGQADDHSRHYQVHVPQPQPREGPEHVVVGPLVRDARTCDSLCHA